MQIRLVLLIPVLAVTAGFVPGCSDDSTDGDAAGTTGSETSTTQEGSTVVTASGPVDLAVGERATIKLDANPTTGYQWEPTSEPDAAVIRIVSDTYLAPSTDAVGAGGVQELVIEGVAAGSTTLEMGYSRPWEQDTAPVETATFTITVG